jgi:tripeptidyl-peptidase I
MKLLALVSLALAVVSYATPTPNHPVALDFFGPMTTKHAWTEIPAQWNHLGPAPDSHTIRLRIGLKQANIDSLVRQLYEVSDPAHERYGKHLTKDQVEELVRPASESVKMVENWLIAHGLDINSPECAMQKSPAGDWVNLNVPVRLAEQMLNTEYNVYQHKRDASNRVVRALSYSLPRSLHDHVDVITPTTMFGTMRSMRSKVFVQPAVHAPGPEIEEGRMIMGPAGIAVSSSCNRAITPTCLMQLYGTSGYIPASTSKNSIGVAGYLEEYASYADLTVCIITQVCLLQV